MTIDDFESILGCVGLPFTYFEFDENVAPPFLTYTYRHNLMSSDDNILFDHPTVFLELFTEKKDTDLEIKLINLFNKNDIVVSHTSESFSDKEHLFLNEFEFEIPLSLELENE